jgi:hypothetical protein
MSIGREMESIKGLWGSLGGGGHQIIRLQKHREERKGGAIINVIESCSLD